MRRIISIFLLVSAFALSVLAVFPLPFSQSRIGAGCPPDSIGGLKLWLKANSLALNDGDPVSTWTDYSGTSNSATSGANQPVFHTSIINGLAAVLFNGSTNGMTFPNDPSVPTSTFVVAQTNIAASSATAYAALIVDSAASGFRICHRLTGTNWGTYVNADLSSGEDLVSGVPNILELTTQTGGASNATVIYRNGVSKANSTVVSSGGAPANHLGYEANNRYYSGYIAEIIVYNSVLSTANRQCIEDNLGAKYNIVVSH